MYDEFNTFDSFNYMLSSSNTNNDNMLYNDVNNIDSIMPLNSIASSSHNDTHWMDMTFNDDLVIDTGSSNNNKTGNNDDIKQYNHTNELDTNNLFVDDASYNQSIPFNLQSNRHSNNDFSSYQSLKYTHNDSDTSLNHAYNQHIDSSTNSVVNENIDDTNRISQSSPPCEIKNEYNMSNNGINRVPYDNDNNSYIQANQLHQQPQQQQNHVQSHHPQSCQSSPNLQYTQPSANKIPPFHIDKNALNVINQLQSSVQYSSPPQSNYRISTPDQLHQYIHTQQRLQPNIQQPHTSTSNNSPSIEPINNSTTTSIRGGSKRGRGRGGGIKNQGETRKVLKKRSNSSATSADELINMSNDYGIHTMNNNSCDSIDRHTKTQRHQSASSAVSLSYDATSPQITQYQSVHSNDINNTNDSIRSLQNRERQLLQMAARTPATTVLQSQQQLQRNMSSTPQPINSAYDDPTRPLPAITMDSMRNPAQLLNPQSYSQSSSQLSSPSTASRISGISQLNDHDINKQRQQLAYMTQRNQQQGKMYQPTAGPPILFNPNVQYTPPTPIIHRQSSKNNEPHNIVKNNNNYNNSMLSPALFNNRSSSLPSQPIPPGTSNDMVYNAGMQSIQQQRMPPQQYAQQHLQTLHNNIPPAQQQNIYPPLIPNNAVRPGSASVGHGTYSTNSLSPNLPPPNMDTNCVSSDSSRADTNSISSHILLASPAAQARSAHQSSNDSDNNNNNINNNNNSVNNNSNNNNIQLMQLQNLLQRAQVAQQPQLLQMQQQAAANAPLHQRPVSGVPGQGSNVSGGAQVSQLHYLLDLLSMLSQNDNEMQSNQLNTPEIQKMLNTLYANESNYSNSNNTIANSTQSENRVLPANTTIPLSQPNYRHMSQFPSSIQPRQQSDASTTSDLLRQLAVNSPAGMNRQSLSSQIQPTVLSTAQLTQQNYNTHNKNNTNSDSHTPSPANNNKHRSVEQMQQLTQTQNQLQNLLGQLSQLQQQRAETNSALNNNNFPNIIHDRTASGNMIHTSNTASLVPQLPPHRQLISNQSIQSQQQSRLFQCMLPKCLQLFTSQQELNSHYAVHAAEPNPNLPNNNNHNHHNSYNGYNNNDLQRNSIIDEMNNNNTVRSLPYPPPSIPSLPIIPTATPNFDTLSPAGSELFRMSDPSQHSHTSLSRTHTPGTISSSLQLHTDDRHNYIVNPQAQQLTMQQQRVQQAALDLVAKQLNHQQYKHNNSSSNNNSHVLQANDTPTSGSTVITSNTDVSGIVDTQPSTVNITNKNDKSFHDYNNNINVTSLSNNDQF